MDDRFFIDERTGCIAVIDRERRDPDDNGLDADRSGVLWYEQGIAVVEVCPHCHHQKSSGWKLKPGARARAEAALAKIRSEADV